MEQVLDRQIPAQKIYKDSTIWVGTFFGGPLTAGYFIAENFKAFNEQDKANKTWVYTIVVTIILFGGVFMIPEMVKMPNQIIALIYTAIAYYIVRHFQGQNIATHINSGGQLHGWGRTIGISVIGLVVTSIPIFGFAFFLSDAVANPSLSSNTYGVMQHEIMFDQNNISESEVDRLAEALTATSFFDQAVTKYVYAEKANGNYELYISVIEGAKNDNQAMEAFTRLRNDMQSLFPDNKISFNLVVDNLDNVVKRIE